MTLMSRLDNYTWMRIILIISWGLTLAAIHLQTTFVYLIPILALITFPLLSPFSVVLNALLLSGNLDLFPAALPGTLKLLLFGMIWLAALGTMVRRRRIGLRPTPSSDPSATAPKGKSNAEGKPSDFQFRHDLQTPVKLILGFCKALLAPTSTFRQPMPSPFREDIEAIYRNAKQIERLHEQLFGYPTSSSPTPTLEPSAPAPQKTLILLDPNGAVFELFSQYLHQHMVIQVTSVDAIGRLKQDIDPVAVLISTDDATLVPLVAQLVGKEVPILTFRLADTALPNYHHIDYLTKPIEFEALAGALERTGATLREVLVVDDNRDQMQMLSRMFNSLSPPPHLLKAYSGREALALLGESKPDVILLDFVLPDMDGRILLEYLQADSRLAQIPVVLVSAHHPPDIFPIPELSKVTFFRLSGLSPIQLVRHIEALLHALNTQR
jgi:CheY-like chemotaxis protein